MELALVACPYCAAMSFGAPPHGEGQPCPLRVKVDQAYIDKLDAERMALIRQPLAMEGMVESMKKISGLGREEDD